MSQPSPDAKAVVRAAEALTTQVRRIADALSTTAVRYEVAADDVATADDDALRRMLTDALTAEHYRRAREQIVASPEEHSAAMAAVAMQVVSVCLAAEATTPAATCSARYAGALLVGDCIRAAGHISDTDHTDASGRHYGDNLAVYPTDSTVKVAHWHPVAEQLTEERQELTSMVGAFVDAQVQHARAADEEQSLRLLRRESLLVLLTRLQRGRTLSEEEAGTLRHHVETEIREADTAREVARSNRRHVQHLAGEIDRLTAEVEQAQAAIERVRNYLAELEGAGWSQATIARRIRAAIDGTEQPTTEPGFTDQHANPDIIGTTEGP